MASTLKITSFLIAGIVIGISPLAKLFPVSSISLYALYALMFLIGIMIGGDTRAWETLRSIDRRIFLIPVVIAVGSLVGAGFVGLFLKGINLRTSLAAGSGFGYYSASAIVAAKLGGASAGSVTLLVNVFREMATLILSPFFRRYFGVLSPVASGGATAMDTTLAVITRASGKEYVPIALFSGFILTIAAPLLVGFILTSF